MDWPPENLDFNIIQAVWDQRDREQDQMQPSSSFGVLTS